MVVWLHLIMLAQHAGRKINLAEPCERASQRRWKVGELVVVSPPASRGIGPQHQDAAGPLSPSPSTNPEVMRPPTGGQLATGEGGGDKLRNASSQHHGQEGGVHIKHMGWLAGCSLTLLGSDARPLRPACLCVMMCLAAGRIFGRRFGIRQRPRTSAPSTEYGGLLGLPFAKHYREPCRVVAARRKEASRTVACRPFVTFCLRSRLPFLGRPGPP